MRFTISLIVMLLAAIAATVYFALHGTPADDAHNPTVATATHNLAQTPTAAQDNPPAQTNATDALQTQWDKHQVGFVDANKQWVVQPQYDMARAFKNGLARVAKDGKWGYINTAGKVVIPLQYDEAQDFGDNGLAMVGVGPLYKHNHYGYINKQGEVVIPLTYDEALPFNSDNLAAVRKGPRTFGAWGYIDATGKEIIPIKYSAVKPFTKDGLAVVQLGLSPKEQYGVVNRQGKFIVPLGAYDFIEAKKNSLLRVIKNKKQGYLNLKGKVAIALQYDDIRHDDFAQHDLALVKLGDKWGYINSRGTMVIAPQYEKAQNFSANGLAAVQLNNKWGYINTEGKMVIANTYEDAGMFDATNKLAMIKQHDKLGYINPNGTIVVEPIFDWRPDWATQTTGKKGYILVTKDGLHGYIDTHGKERIAPIYTYIGSHFYQDIVAACKPTGCGLIDTQEQVVLPFEYDRIEEFGENGLAAANKSKLGWGAINTKGEQVIPFKYAQIQNTNAENGGLMRVTRTDGKTYLLNAQGKEIKELITNPNTLAKMRAEYLANQAVEGAQEQPNYAVALQFIKSYFSEENQENDSWVNHNPYVTDNFKQAFVQAQKEAFQADPDMGFGFDPIVDMQDMPDTESLFIAEKMGLYVILRSKTFAGTDFVFKLAKQDGKWLVDGAGIINIPKDKQAKR